MYFQYVVDAANSAFYVIFTVLDYPPGVDEMLNELPDAVRPNQEVKANLQAIIDKGWFTLKIYKADHKGTIVSKAEVTKGFMHASSTKLNSTKLFKICRRKHTR